MSEASSEREQPDTPSAGLIPSVRSWYHTHLGWRGEGFWLIVYFCTITVLTALAGAVYTLSFRRAQARFVERLPPWLGGEREADAAVAALVALAATPVLLALLAWALRSWRRYRRWPLESSFRVYGWNTLACAPALCSPRQWCSCEIEVRLGDAREAGGYRDGAPNAAPAALAVRAALEAFVAQADRRRTAMPADGDDPRRPWRVEGCTAYGSANAAVALDLYRLCAGPLDAVARQHPSVRAVHIRVGEFAAVSEPERE